LAAGRSPSGWHSAEAITAPAVLDMLAGVASRVREVFSPGSWLIVEGDSVVGLCSITRPPQNGSIDIGYGIASSRRNRGIASRAVQAVVDWAHGDPRVQVVTADTSPDNIPSQRVLERAGFIKTGERLDPEDGPVICWRCETDRPVVLTRR
jgi:RimJ/RimL family protein N-acetyltransferase